MSEDIDINAIATEAMSESPSETSKSTETTTAVTPEKTVTTTEPSKVEKTVTQDTSQQKLSRRQAAAKESSDYRAQAEKRESDWKRERLQLQTQLKQFDPILPYINQFQKAAEEQKRQEELQRYQQNPQSFTEQRMQEMVQQAIAPYQQKQQEAEMDNFTNNSLNQIKEYAGSEETYNAVSPYMKHILDSTMKTDPDAADKLARSPEFLYLAAEALYNRQNKQDQTRQESQQALDNQKSKAEMAKFNGGISKPNRVSKTPMTTNRESAKQNAFDFIRELTGQN